jgi:hypothetical protein
MLNVNIYLLIIIIIFIIILKTYDNNNLFNRFKYVDEFFNVRGKYIVKSGLIFFGCT